MKRKKARQMPDLTNHAACSLSNMVFPTIRKSDFIVRKNLILEFEFLCLCVRGVLFFALKHSVFKNVVVISDAGIARRFVLPFFGIRHLDRKIPIPIGIELSWRDRNGPIFSFHFITKVKREASFLKESNRLSNDSRPFIHVCAFVTLVSVMDIYLFMARVTRVI